MATTTLGKVSLTMGGAYAPTATYDRLTVVYGSDGNSYCTKADGVSGIEPGVTAGWESYWQLLCESGEVQEITLVPTLTAGTKIAEITIDGTTYDLYAPSGGGGGGDLPSGGNVGDVLMKTADGTEWSDDVTELKSAINVSVLTPAGNTHTLQPCPVTYNFGEKAELTVTVTATSQYHFMFSCPSSAATVLTMNGITGTSGDTLEAGKTYEVDIWAGIALIRGIEVTAV